MRHKLFKIAVPLTLIAVLVVGFFMYDRINSMYPNPQKIRVGLNESISYKDVEISATGMQFVDADELQASFPDLNLSYASSGAVIVKVNLKFYSKKDTNFSLGMLSIQNSLLAEAPSLDIMYEIQGTIKLEIPAGSTVTTDVYYLYMKDSFYASDWKRIRELPYTLELVNTYPRLYQISLQ